MTIEAILTDILTELKAIRTDLNAPIKPSTLATLATLPQSPVAPVPPAPPAPSTAVAVPPPTAPAAPTDSSPPPTSVFGQGAVPSAPVATPAAPPTASPVGPASAQQPALGVPTASPAGPASAPAAPVSAPAGPGSPELDVHGLPWDGRIHASSKAKVADGSWRMKRGVDEALVTTVTAELKSAMAAPAPVPAFGAWPIPAPADVPPPPAAPAPGVIPPPPPTSPYAALMSRLTHHINVGDFTPQQVNDVCAKMGVPNVAALAAREDLVPSVALALGVAI